MLRVMPSSASRRPYLFDRRQNVRLAVRVTVCSDAQVDFARVGILLECLRDAYVGLKPSERDARGMARLSTHREWDQAVLLARWPRPRRTWRELWLARVPKRVSTVAALLSRRNAKGFGVEVGLGGSVSPAYSELRTPAIIALLHL